jgi:hypothetical protein
VVLASQRFTAEPVEIGAPLSPARRPRRGTAVSGSGHSFTCWDYAYEGPYYGHCTNS